MRPDYDSGPAFTGLEAAIILIAFILVASVFAYVVLGTGFFTTQKTQETIHSSVETASSTLQLTGDVYGIGTAGVGMDMINFSVSLAAGSTPVDFEKVTITCSNETNLETLTPVSGLKQTSTPAGWWSWAIISAQSEQGTPNNLLDKGEQFTISAHPTWYVPKNIVFVVEVKPGLEATLSIKRNAPAAIDTMNKVD